MIQNTSRLVHVRFDGRSCDIPVSDLDVGVNSSDEQVKNRLATYLNVQSERLQFYTVDRHETGNLTVRPQAVFG